MIRYFFIVFVFLIHYSFINGTKIFSICRLNTMIVHERVKTGEHINRLMVIGFCFYNSSSSPASLKTLFLFSLGTPYAEKTYPP